MKVIKPGVTEWNGSYIFDLNESEFQELTRAVNGTGGFQDFLRRLQAQTSPAVKIVRLTPQDIDQLPHYAFDYKQGGFEDRLLGIFGRLLGPKLTLSEHSN